MPDEEVLVLLPTSSNNSVARAIHGLREVGKMNYEIDMPDKRKKKKVFHINMLKKWYLSVATSFWTAEETDSEPEVEKSLATWESEYGVPTTIGTQLSKQ